MKVAELRVKLNTLADYNKTFDDYDVVIEMPDTGQMGGTNCVNVKSIYQGIDWNSGKLFISPEKGLKL